MTAQQTTYFAADSKSTGAAAYEAALDRCVLRLRETLRVAGLRNPKIGHPDNTWAWCNGPDWVMGFLSGQIWLAHQLTGDPVFAAAAKARRPQLREVLDSRKARDHDLGFIFSLSSVAEWQTTGNEVARAMGIEAARALVARFREEGAYLQAWNAVGPQDRAQARFANGRMIADTIQNLALLHWAHRETGINDFREVADLHMETSARYLVRDDDTTFHTYRFDPATGEPLGGETHQGYADTSCWARGQAWLIHGFANCHRLTGAADALDMARRLAAKAESLMGATTVPVWDYALPADGTHPVDSSAAAVMAAGLLMLADLCPDDLYPGEAAQWRGFAHRLLDGLLAECDLTTDPTAQGLLAHGAAHVPAGREDTMLPYGDYYFMEALMRAQGHRAFFW